MCFNRDSGEAEEATGNAQNIECDENSFHMKEDYLQSLGIKLPLTNWVTVTNVSLNLFINNKKKCITH